MSLKWSWTLPSLWREGKIDETARISPHFCQRLLLYGSEKRHTPRRQNKANQASKDHERKMCNAFKSRWESSRVEDRCYCCCCYRHRKGRWTNLPKTYPLAYTKSTKQKLQIKTIWQKETPTHILHLLNPTSLCASRVLNLRSTLITWKMERKSQLGRHYRTKHEVTTNAL